MADTKHSNATEQNHVGAHSSSETQAVRQSSPVQQTIVIKLGTSVLTGGTLQLDRAHMVELVRQCASLRRQGHKVIMVTSGAIAAGREHLGYPELPKTMASKQLLAAVGQSRLIQEWESLFGIYGLHVGQMLLTRADLDDRERYLNARDMIVALLDNGIILSSMKMTQLPLQKSKSVITITYQRWSEFWRVLTSCCF